MPQTVLICEDDLVLGETLEQLLCSRGYRVQLVRDGNTALGVIRRRPPSLLVLDLMLPDMDGFDVCRRLRTDSPLPILMISGRAGEIDRIVGLEIGADDFLVKPFGLSELAARIDAHLRRCSDYSQRSDGPSVSEIGDLRLDLDAREVGLGGKQLHLTPKEYELLAALAEHRGSVVRSCQLLMRVWGYDSSIRTRTLDVHIGRLRAKIEEDTRNPRYLLTVPGVGYKLCAPEPEARAA